MANDSSFHTWYCMNLEQTNFLQYEIKNHYFDEVIDVDYNYVGLSCVRPPDVYLFTRLRKSSTLLILPFGKIQLHT